MTTEPYNAPETAARSNNDPNAFDLHRVLHVVSKHRWMILLTVVGVVAATAVYTSRLPKRYIGTASIVIDPSANQVLGKDVQEVVQLGSGTLEYYNTQVSILGSIELAKETVKRNDLHKRPELIKGAAEGLSEDELIQHAATVLRRRLSVHPPKRNHIVKVSTEESNPELAALLANALVDTYIQYNIDLRTKGTDRASKWLTQELDEAEKTLRDAEAELFKFKKDNDILSVSLEDKQNLIVGNIQRFTESANTTRAKRIELNALLSRVKETRKQKVLESPIFSLAEDASAGQTLKSQYYLEEAKYTQLSKSLGPKHPDLLAQKQKVDEVLHALNLEADLVVEAVEQRTAASATAEGALIKEVETHKQEALNLGPKTIAYNRLLRQQRDAEEKYKIVLSRLRASDLSSRLKEVNIRLLDRALPPTFASYPSMPRNLAVAFLLAIALSLSFAFGLELLDRTIKTAEDVANTVAAPMLGVIPIVADDGGDGIDRDLAVFRDPKSRVAECCRSIRTNLLFMAADKDFKTLVVTSPKPREGKTTSVLYLGTTMAQSGQRVLVIDSDMRRPRLHKSLGVGRTTGLSNVIVGECELEDAIKTTEIPNLSILPCGPTPPNPAELLMTDSFKRLLEELGTRYDRILLDSPPILAVTDAVVLSRLTDGVVLVMKAGSTLRVEAARATSALRDVDGRIVGVIVNELDLENRTYGYSYQYYTYAYGSPDTKNPEPTAS